MPCDLLVLKVVQYIYWSDRFHKISISPWFVTVNINQMKFINIANIHKTRTWVVLRWISDEPVEFTYGGISGLFTTIHLSVANGQNDWNTYY